MKVCLNEVIVDLIQLCEVCKDNKMMIREIQDYFGEFNNRHLKVLDMRDE